MSKIMQGVDCGDNVKEIICDGNCKVFKMENETGEGVMTAYEVFPGAIVMFNDFHMSSWMSWGQEQIRQREWELRLLF
ncbi:MAG: hypothetical protein IIV45_15300 [Lachnospiraceae bacterium]|nr:hypothetical protein [Lachnospiraceae bacterium]